MTDIKDHGKWMRSMLRPETADGTPQCPDPETLLDWLEQGDKHPEAGQLLAHLFSCAHCRQQRLALREIRALKAERQSAVAGSIDPALIRSLSAKVEKWVRELIAKGMIAPIASVRGSLERLQKLAPSPTLTVARGQEAPADLRPAGTAIRSGQPNLRWSPGRPGRKYEIVILQPIRNGFRSAWEGRAGSDLQFTLPAEAELQPGSYLWQVIELAEDRKVPSALAGFVVLKEPIRREIETQEREIEHSPLARIGLYEAYGLYEEALQQAETLIRVNAEDETARRIHTRILQHIFAAPYRPS